MRIVAVGGAGIGTSAILQVNAERSFAEIIEVVNYFDVDEIAGKLEASLG